MDTVPVLCECNSFGCSKSIQLPIATAFEIRQKGYVVIVDDCPTGPDTTDTLVEKRDGYSLYQES